MNGLWATVILLALAQVRPGAPSGVRWIAAPPTGYANIDYVAPYPVLSHHGVPPDDGIVVDTRSIVGFGGGQYLVWNVFGHVRIRVSVDAGPNALVSGVFIGPQRQGTNPVTFVGTNTAAQGTWKGVYGGAGASVAGDATTLPVGVSLLVDAPPYTWADSSTDARAVQRLATTDRVMAAWYGANYTIDLNVATAPREVAVYAADYDGSGRKQTYTVVTDAPPVPLDVWVLAGWEVASFDGATLIKSHAYDTFPSENLGEAWFGVPLDLFPDADKPYTVSIRYVTWTTVDINKPHIVSYSTWSPAPQAVIRRADGTIDLR